MRSIAKLFTRGRSQAVRLPKEFRFEGKEVRISRIGDRVILEPVGELGPMPWDQIDRLGDTPFMPGGRDQPARQQNDIEAALRHWRSYKARKAQRAERK